MESGKAEIMAWMATVSILLPFHNAGPTLAETLTSICRQTFKDFELLAVDDHSTDQGRSILERLAAKDPRVRLLDSPFRGLVPALNLGLLSATAPLVARMDADDLMHPERLQRQAETLGRNPDLALVGSATRAFPASEISGGFREYLRWQNQCNNPYQIHDEIYIESPFAHPSVMFRKPVVMALGGYRDGPFPEDYELWLRMRHAGYRMAKLEQELLDWRDYPRRTSRTDPRCSRESFDRLRADYLARDPLVNLKKDALIIWGAGRKTRRRCRLLLDRGFRLQSWIDIDPRKIGNRVADAPVNPPEWLAGQSPRPLVLVYVANHGAREQIAEDLHRMDYRRGRDYLMVG